MSTISHDEAKDALDLIHPNEMEFGPRELVVAEYIIQQRAKDAERDALRDKLASVEAERDRWRREAMAARPFLHCVKLPEGAIDVYPVGARWVVDQQHRGFRDASTINAYGDALAANPPAPGTGDAP